MGCIMLYLYVSIGHLCRRSQVFIRRNYAVLHRAAWLVTTAGGRPSLRRPGTGSSACEEIQLGRVNNVWTRASSLKVSMGHSAVPANVEGSSHAQKAHTLVGTQNSLADWQMSCTQANSSALEPWVSPKRQVNIMGGNRSIHSGLSILYSLTDRWLNHAHGLTGQFHVILCCLTRESNASSVGMFLSVLVNYNVVCATTESWNWPVHLLHASNTNALHTTILGSKNMDVETN